MQKGFLNILKRIMGTLAKIQFSYECKFTKEQQIQIKELAWEAYFEPSENESNISCVQLIMLIEDAAKFGEFKVLKTLGERFTSRISDFGNHYETIVNEKCNVAVAGLGMLTIDEVKCNYDLCTESLQDELDKGWRIIAICVQPDQRRPDYILGRTKKD